MAPIPTTLHFSAGGVAFRRRRKRVEVALISVGAGQRWQLPKGLIDPGETTEAAAIREVREETGLETESAGRIDKVEYWYYSGEDDARERVHKFVYFYLLHFKSGDIADHDREVNEAAWVEIDQAIETLAFKSEKKIVERAKEMIASLGC